MRLLLLSLLLPSLTGVALRAQSLSFKDIHPSTGSSDPEELVVVDGTLYFQADDGTHGTELWRSDGTSEGTSLVHDIHPSGSSSPSGLTEMNGTLYFYATDGASQVGLWKHNSSGTAFVKGPLLVATALTVFDGLLYFVAFSASSGTGLWQSDGTPGGTVLLKRAEFTSPVELVPFNGALFFRAADGGSGHELWKTDGTPGGTVLVKDISSTDGSSPNAFTPVGDALFFAATTSAAGTELWKTDGTTAGTVLVKDIVPGTISGLSFPNTFASFGDALYFTADDRSHGRELWRSDGTPEGTSILEDINPGDSSTPFGFTVYDGALYFRADDGTHGTELWKTDGTALGTVRVKDINSGFGGSFPTDLTPHDGELYFQALQELWKTDGTDAGTMLVQHINPGGPSDPIHFTSFDGALYFQADDGTNGTELWKLGGTSLPVELISFEAMPADEAVVLSWGSASETNNAGFEIQRMSEERGATWEVVAFVEGHGTTTETQAYRFTDADVPFGATTLRYRLRQIDFDGGFEYSPEMEVNLALPSAFALEAAYPNPFNPTTTIRYALPQAGEVRLVVYDVLGREVALLVDGVQQAGRHAVVWEASGLSSGTYLYRIEAGAFQQARQVLLVK